MLTGPEQVIPLEPISDATHDCRVPASSASIGAIVKLASSLGPEDRLRIIAGVWASLPPWHSAAPTPAQLVELQDELEDYDAGGTGRFDWAAVRRLIAAGCPKEAAKIYSAPRRFDLWTIFVVTLAYSLLFGVMKTASFPAGVSLAIAGFISLVAVAQAFLFGGSKPRTASLIAGALIYSLMLLAEWIIIGPRLYPSAFILAAICYAIIGGAILGYLAGVLVGGVFLVSDKLRKRFSRKSDELRQNEAAGIETIHAGGDSPWAN